MKKVLLTFGIALLGFTVAFAQDMGEPQEEIQTPTETEMGMPDADMDQSGREQLEVADLPAAVSEALETGAYSTMTVSEVYKVEAEATDETEIGVETSAYEVHLESEDGQSTIVKFNEEGQILKSEEAQY